MTFGVAEGVVGLVGPPGVGKSTLLATFATLRRPNTGALHILGHDTAHAVGLRAARARIGYLPGRLSRAEHMTAGEFVAYAAYYKRTSASAARDMVKRLDLTEAAGTELSLLPPDVRLRAGIAAACVHRPDVVLLDDPFGRLCAAAEPWPAGAAGPGPGARAAAVAELMPVVRSLAPTVVISSDARETLTGWCDRLLSLARGRLTELPAQSAAARRGRSSADRRDPAARRDPADRRDSAGRRDPADRTPPDRSETGRFRPSRPPADRPPPDRSASEWPALGRHASDRAAASERPASDLAASERAGSERTASERLASERAVSGERRVAAGRRAGGEHRAGDPRPAGAGARRAAAPKRRPARLVLPQMTRSRANPAPAGSGAGV
ncbi:ATP-binding cassette domain-containing protein [Actinomadura fibrosa]|uniref:ATP-binding cassette domain-containing protein n=1 Tax=Actinomadura fibrosa TaxID=111802 RepID=A0ABW2XV18_9ACTN|nr:ATP-binding cassette domain-containing protein [Actinomadura fibrosa]